MGAKFRKYLLIILIICCMFAGKALVDKVWALPASVTTDGFISELRKDIVKHYKVKPNDILIVWLDKELDQRVKDAGIEGPNVTVTISKHVLSTVSGKNMLPVEININNKFVKRIMLKVKVDIWKGIYITSAKITKGEVITKKNVIKKRKLISGLPNEAINSTDKIYGKVASWNLSSGQVLTKVMVRPQKVVFRGKKVVILVKDINLTLKAQGIAIGDGYLGEKVKIQVLSFNSKKIIEAKAIGENLVEIDISSLKKN